MSTTFQAVKQGAIDTNDDKSWSALADLAMEEGDSSRRDYSDLKRVVRLINEEMSNLESQPGELEKWRAENAAALDKYLPQIMDKSYPRIRQEYDGKINSVMEMKPEDFAYNLTPVRLALIEAAETMYKQHVQDWIQTDLGVFAKHCGKAYTHEGGSPRYNDGIINDYGFLSDLVISTHDFIEHGAALATELPNRVVLTGPMPTAEQVEKFPPLTKRIALSFDNHTQVSAEHMEGTLATLGASPLAPYIAELDLCFKGLTDIQARVLNRASGLTGLDSLNIQQNNLSPAGIREIMGGKNFERTHIHAMSPVMVHGWNDPAEGPQQWQYHQDEYASLRDLQDTHNKRAAELRSKERSAASAQQDDDSPVTAMKSAGGGKVTPSHTYWNIRQA